MGSNHTHGVDGKGWYAFDLDGTLAVDDGWKGIEHIGEPIKPMVDLMKRLNAEGKLVKILTARVFPRSDSNPGDAKKYIVAWCEKNLGFVPEIVCQKDPLMIYLFDDRCVQVEKNTGRILGALPEDLEESPISRLVSTIKNLK